MVPFFGYRTESSKNRKVRSREVTSTRHPCQYRFISHGGMCLCFVLCRLLHLHSKMA